MPINFRNLRSKVLAPNEPMTLESARNLDACFRDILGISTDEYGRPCLNAKLSDGSWRARPEEFSIRQVAESFFGDGWVRSLDPTSHEVFEAGDAAVGPGHFPNISAFNSTISGLIEVKLLEAYRTPSFIADMLVRNIPTRQRSEKLPGLGRVGDLATTFGPGQPHPRAQFGERFVTTPETSKNGLAIEVTAEAVFFDLTNQVLMQAETVGAELALRKEKRVLDCVLGVTNTYSYGGTAYNTYLTTGNWINDQSNPLLDWTDLDAAEQLFAAMTDQEAGERIVVEPDTILVMPYKKRTAMNIVRATTVETRGGASGAFGEPFVPQEVRTGPNADSGINVLSSPIAYQRLTDTDGSALSASVAREYWYYGEFKRAFGYMENWAMQVKKASPSDFAMLDSGLLLAVFADEMGVPAVLEPRYVVRNKN